MHPSNESSPLAKGPFTNLSDAASPETVRIALTEEQLHVTTRPVETGQVKLIKAVHETDETVTVPLLREEYSVERKAINQYVDELPVTRQEGQTTIYPVVKEVLVVQKRLLLVEEIRVTHQQTQVEETQTVRLRRDDITVDRTTNNPERPA